MILFFDNDIGRGVPDALHSVNIGVLSVLKRYRRGNTPDTRWLRDAGANGWLVISCNKDILNVDEERELIISEKVGIVFLTSGQEKAREILNLILRKWSWLEKIDREVERPFVFFLGLNGRARRHNPITPLAQRRLRRSA